MRRRRTGGAIRRFINTHNPWANVDLRTNIARWQMWFLVATLVFAINVVAAGNYRALAVQTASHDENGEPIILPEYAYVRAIQAHLPNNKICQIYGEWWAYHFTIFTMRLCNRGWKPDLLYYYAHYAHYAAYSGLLALFAAHRAKKGYKKLKVGWARGEFDVGESLDSNLWLSWAAMRWLRILPIAVILGTVTKHVDLFLIIYGLACVLTFRTVRRKQGRLGINQSLRDEQRQREQRNRERERNQARSGNSWGFWQQLRFRFFGK